jgi:hypothetical protein
MKSQIKIKYATKMDARGDSGNIENVNVVNGSKQMTPKRDFVQKIAPKRRRTQ